MVIQNTKGSVHDVTVLINIIKNALFFLQFSILNWFAQS